MIEHPSLLLLIQTSKLCAPLFGMPLTSTQLLFSGLSQPQNSRRTVCGCRYEEKEFVEGVGGKGWKEKARGFTKDLAHTS